MPSTERDTSRDSERVLKHQHSASSDTSRAIVPMWDSSDPERAPPPLPMNPSSPNVASKPNTSIAIQSAHAALTEKARESTYMTNPPPRRAEVSPERSLIRGAAHKRMQSLQTGNVRDLSSFLEGGSLFGSPKSPEKSVTRPNTPHTSKDLSLEARRPEKSPEKLPEKLLEKSPEKSPEKESDRSASPTAGRETPTRDFPTVRPSLRRPPQSILGDNTPPQSATMLALQNMGRDLDSPVLHGPNGSTALVRTPQTFDAISNQILSLTSIATNLQREMAQLSRRSKDNATDLVSLKEATNARDEDIRKSLRELVSNLAETGSRSSSAIYGNGPLYLDSKPHNSPSSRNSKTVSLPRIPSPNSFSASIDRESMSSPCPVSSDGAASIALLEKVLREMGTKEGQENLVSRLTEVGDRLSRDGMSTAKRLDELLDFIKSNSPQMSVAQKDGGMGNQRPRNFSFDDPPRLELDFDQPRSGPMTQGPMTQRVEALLNLAPNKENMGRPNTARASEVVNDDVIKIIRSVKDSVAQGGGLTAEVKALVRELRGEVLGMGREIGRKLDQVGKASDSTAKDSNAEKGKVARVVQDGLDELKQHLEDIMRENRRQSVTSAVSRNTVDYQEIYNAMRAAINEKPRDSSSDGLQKEEIIEAVKEAWENYKPDIELQQFGLEREELLECLKEGIQQYAPQDHSQHAAGATREEVFTAVIEGLKHFSPPRVQTEASLSREEILDAVRECLEEFEFPAAPAPEPRETGITRDDMLDAVQEGLHGFDFPTNTNAVSRDIGGGVTRDDMVDAAREALHTFDFPANATTSNRDVEPSLTRDDVLDAIKEGLHGFDFAANTTALSRDVGGSVTRDDMVEAASEALHMFDFPASTASQNRDIEPTVTRDDVLDAIKEGLHTFDFASSSPSHDDVLDAVKEGLHTFDFAANTTIREDVLTAVNESLQAFDFTGNSMALSRDVGGSLNRDDIFDAVKAGLEEAPLQIDPYGEQIMDRLQDIMQEIHTEFKAVSDEAKQNVAAHGRDTEQVLDATKDGFEKLRTDIESYVDRAAGTPGKDEILDGITENFNALRADVEVLLSDKSAGSMEAVQGELEHLRQTMATSLVHGGGNIDKDEILDALRDGLDGIRADIERPREANESDVSGTGDILDALHDGLTGLRAEVEKVHNKPVDMTVNYEILDALKAGFESLRIDIDRLRENGYGERAVAELNDGAVIAAEGLKRNDIENLEVLITQLRIKIDALESTPPPAPEPAQGSLSKDDLSNVEHRLAEVHETIERMSSRDRSAEEDNATKDDVAAIETLLRNAKAKIDEMDPEQTVKKDHLDAVELLLFETHESVKELKTHLEDVSKRDDVNMIEGLLRGVVEGLDEMKQRTPTDEEDAEKVTKTDVEAVEALCLDVKDAIEQRVLTDIADLASKEDVKNLSQMVKEFNGRIETHAGNNAKAFEERQAETVGVGERVTEIKDFLEEFREVIKEKLSDGATSVEALGKFLENMGETIDQNANVADDLKDMFETMKTEFEKSNAGVVGSKLEADEKFQITWDRFDAKIDEKFNELLTKYEDAEVAAGAKAKTDDEKSAGVEAAMLGTKAVAEELKVVVDTLGVTLTDSVEKMDEASKTVFSRVDETFTRVEETHADAKAEHQLTREQVSKTIGAVEGVHSQVTEYHPKILDSIKDILLIVGQHYEHSKTTNTTLQEKIEGIPQPAPPPEVPLLRDAPAPEKYDDAPVHEKLDKLVDHMHAAGKSFAQLDMLDKIHRQVMQTASEVSEFVSTQTQRISDDHEDKEKAVEAASIALETRLAQKEHVEANVAHLREEEERLKESVSILRAEQDDLAHQKMRLSADVSSLETALRIRREELQAMEGRAEGLERRILEGVIDHSRAMLLSKSNKGRDAMSRKRVPSHAASVTGSVSSAATSRASYTTQSAVNMAMGGNRPMASVPINNPAGGASRRILSLNQITHNVPTGGMKRSHSVKNPGGSGAMRKSSWGGSLNQKYGDLNKENLALKELVESDEDDDNDLADASDGEDHRRSSRGTTIMTGTGTAFTESTIDEGTEWTGSMDGEDHDGNDENSTTGPHQVVLYEEDGLLV